MQRKKRNILLIILLSIIVIIDLFPVAVICGGPSCGVSGNYDPMHGGEVSITYRVKPLIILLLERLTETESSFKYFDYTDSEVVLK